MVFPQSGGGGGRGIPVVQGGGGVVVFLRSQGGALPVKIPQPRPPGLAASLRLC